MLITRRSLTLGALGGALASTVSLPALAKAPKLGVQAPGYYRTMVGSSEVTVLADGFIPLGAKLFTGDPSAQSVLGADTVKTSVNGWLVNTGDRLILIDSGGSGLTDSLGKLSSNLLAAGYALDQVDVVVMTHLHGDHCSGLTAGGQAVFRNAVVRVAEAELAFWSSAENLAKAPEGMKGQFKLIETKLKPYRDAGRIQTFRTGEVVPGVTAEPAPGHTPGHTMFRIASGGAQLLIWGDIAHNAALQIPEPSRSIAYDVDPAMAVETRKKVLDQIATDTLAVAGAHLPFPGVGRIIRIGGTYGYVAEPWSQSI